MSTWFESVRATPVALANADIHVKQFMYQPYGHSYEDKGWEDKHLTPNSRAWKKKIGDESADILVTYKGVDANDPVFLVPDFAAGRYFCDSEWYESKTIKTVGKIVKNGRRKSVEFLPEFSYLAK